VVQDCGEEEDGDDPIHVDFNFKRNRTNWSHCMR
jgi:hypothetical protein